MGVERRAGPRRACCDALCKHANRCRLRRRTTPHPALRATFPGGSWEGVVSRSWELGPANPVKTARPVLYVTSLPGLEPGRRRLIDGVPTVAAKGDDFDRGGGRARARTDRSRRQAGRGRARRREERRLRRHVLHDGDRRVRFASRRGGRGQGRAALDRPEGGIVPARLANGLQGRPPVGDLRLLQSERDLGLRLRRERRDHAGKPRGTRPAGLRTSYWRLPASAYDEADDLRRWALLGLEAARRAAEAKPKPRARKPA